MSIEISRSLFKRLTFKISSRAWAPSSGTSASLLSCWQREQISVSHKYKSMPGKYYNMSCLQEIFQNQDILQSWMFLLIFLPFLQMYFLVLSSPEWPQASPGPSPSLLWPNAAPAVLLNRQRLKSIHVFWVFIHILTFAFLILQTVSNINLYSSYLMPGGCEGGPVGRRTIPLSCSVNISIDYFSLSLSVNTQHTNNVCMYMCGSVTTIWYLFLIPWGQVFLVPLLKHFVLPLKFFI